MPTILPAMGLTLPVRGSAGAGQWADALDADLTKLDAHNHISGKGNQIPTAGIAIDADLTFSGTWAPKNLHRIQFASVAALSDNAQNLSLFVSTDHELYYRNFTGNNVKLTLGTALNVAAFVGGIGGDYSAVGAQLNYDDAGKRYKLLNGSADVPAHGWAVCATGAVHIFETATTESLYVGLQAPTGLATIWNITLPLAAPVSTAIVQMDSSGVLTANNTIANDVTLAAGKHVTVSGAGLFKHPTKTIIIQVVAPTTGTFNTQPATVVGAGNTWFCQISGLTVGSRITGARARVLDSATGPTTLVLALSHGIDGAPSGVDGTSPVSNGLGAVQTIAVTGATAIVTSGRTYHASIGISSGTASCSIYQVEVDFDQP